jgi:crotonobetainyl-CoA:carnitine CoA-transferase CaiB-like acyl-CoA transferase
MPKQDNEKTTQGVGPLDGLLIADFSRVLAGPYCTMLLGDLGATVIRVESPQGDDTRTWMPPDRKGVATYYLAINRNKRSITLDFTDSADLGLAHELAARADVFIENFKPGGLKRFGLDYEAVQQRNAEIIYASIVVGTAQGASLSRLRPHRASNVRVNETFTVTSDGPALSLRDPGVRCDGRAAQPLAFWLPSTTVSLPGEGQHVEVSLFATAPQDGQHYDCLCCWRRRSEPHGQCPSQPVPYEPLPTADLDLIIAAGNNGQFRQALRDPRSS